MRLATKSALLVAVIAALLSFAKFDHCRSTGWGGADVYVHACYSDLPALLIDRHLNTHDWPYKDGASAVEYPPGVAMVMWVTSFAINHDYNQYRAYFDINALLIFILFIFVVVLLKKMSPQYWYLAPLAPAVIASLFINWDLWAVAPALLSIYWFDQKLYRRSALTLGIAIATKFFPIVLLLPALIILRKSSKFAINYLATTLGFAALINLPFALTTPAGWWRFYKLNITRGVDWGSLWHAISIYGVNTNASYQFSTYNLAGVVPERYVEIITTPNPNTAMANSLYTYTTQIQEGNGAPIIITGNANNEIVYAPPPDVPLDYNDLDLMQ